jgi:hypothetical protein
MLGKLLKRLLRRSDSTKELKGKVVRKAKWGDLEWVQVYLPDSPLPYEFLAPKGTPDETLIHQALTLREIQRHYGLA